MADRRIGGKGGGSDKGSRSGTNTLLVFAFVLALGAGGTSAVIGGASGAGSSGARGSIRVGNQNSAAVEARLVRKGFRVTTRLTDDGTSCAEHAYGQVQDFLSRRPCAGLHRASLEVRDRDGDVVLLAVSWVEMPDEASARAFNELVDIHGSGNITELSRERGRFQTIRFTGYPYASGRDDTVVVNAQAQPVARGAGGLALTSIVTEAVR